MKQLITAIALLLISIISNAQKGYYKTDSSLSTGVQLMEYRSLHTPEYCTIERAGSREKLSPAEIKEFGYKNNGVTFISKEIEVNNTDRLVFLERLVQGPITLYYYRDRNNKLFFIESDSIEFRELPKGSKGTGDYYKEKLNSLTNGCDNMQNGHEKVDYAKYKMKRYFNKYTECSKRPIPYRRFGVVFGYEVAKLTSTDGDYKYFVTSQYLDPQSSFTIGLNYDAPIGASNFSFYPELYFSYHQYEFFATQNLTTIDFKSELGTVHLPLFFKYTLPFKVVRPYFNAGPVFAMNVINNTTVNIEMTLLTGGSTVNNDTDAIGFINPGYSFGAGIEFRLNHKHSVFVEARTNKVYDKINKQFNNVMVGFNF